MEDRLKNVIASVLGIGLNTIDENLLFKNLWDWDSLKHINLVTALEEEFGVEFSDEEISEMVTYKFVRDVCRKKVDGIQGNS
jgi:acyl carrier protein